MDCLNLWSESEPLAEAAFGKRGSGGVRTGDDDPQVFADAYRLGGIERHFCRFRHNDGTAELDIRRR